MEDILSDSTSNTNESDQRPTLRTIAEITGLSLSTVSLGMRDSNKLKESTHKRIVEAAATVGYVPNRAGIRLRTGKTNVIALVMSGAENSSDYVDHIIRGIAEGIEGTRYHLTVHPRTGKSTSLDMVRYVLENRTADGIILTHTSPDDPRVKFLLERDFPFATHGRTHFKTPHPYYDLDGDAFIEMAVQRFVDKRCRQIMPVFSSNDTTYYAYVKDALYRACAVSNMAIFAPPAHIRLERVSEVSKLGFSLAHDENRPDGYLCDSEMGAIALMTGLQRGGVGVGRDVTVVARQNSENLSALYPAVDGLFEDVEAAGRCLVKDLVKRIEGVAVAELQTLVLPVANFSTAGV